MHVFECDCPPIEEWEIDPYVEGGPSAAAGSWCYCGQAT
jgi:hypothetical protein